MHIVILITVGDREEGLALGRALVGEGLAACVNIIGGVRSVYRWKGKVEEGDECLLAVKSRKELLGRITARVKELHSYEVPEVIALEIAGGSEEYLDWVTGSTGPS